MKSCTPVFTLRSRIAMATLFLSAASSLMSGAEMKAEDVVARHLDSIGTAEARSAAKTRLVQGTSRFKIALNGSGEPQGTSALVSEGRKVVVMIKLANSDYVASSSSLTETKFTLRRPRAATAVPLLESSYTARTRSSARASWEEP
jgi:hypothetical protein